MFDQNLIIVTIFLALLLLVWAGVKIFVDGSKGVKSSFKFGSNFRLKDKITLEPGVSVYLLSAKNSDLVVTVDSRKSGNIETQLLPILSIIGADEEGDENA